jgi:MFS family permease
MMAADVVRAVVQILLALAFFTDSIQIWHLAVGSAIFGAATSFFNPASTGLVPEVVSAARLQEANALLGLARSAITIFGPVSAGLMVTTLGFGAVFAVDAVSFVASFVCLAAMRLSRTLAKRERTSMLAEALAGLQVVRRQRWMVAGLSCDAAFNLALSAYFVLGPVIFNEHFGGASDWAWMLTAFSVGAVVGGVVVLRYRPARPLLAAYTIGFVTPALLVALAWPAPLTVLVVGATLFGLEVVIANTFWETMEQQHIPAEYLSRASSLSWMTSLIVTPIGLAIVGPLSDVVGVEATLIGAGALAAIALVGALAVPEFRNLRRLDEAEVDLVAS